MHHLMQLLLDFTMFASQSYAQFTNQHYRGVHGLVWVEFVPN